MDQKEKTLVRFDSVPGAKYEEFSMLYVRTVENSFHLVYLYNIQPVFLILFHETITIM